MPRPPSNHPTELELEILKIVWRDGASSGRHVRDAVAAAGRDLAYTSVLTVMNIMARKGYLRRSRRREGFVYVARINRGRTLGRMMRDLVDRAFAGSPSAALLSLLETADLDSDELQRIRDVLDRKSRKDPP